MASEDTRYGSSQYGSSPYGGALTDADPPILQNQDPAPSDTGVDPGTSIYLEVVDQGSGVKLDTVVLAVNSDPAYQNGAQQPDFSVIVTPIEYGYGFTISPHYLLPDSSSTQIDVDAEDYDANALDTNYSFTTGVASEIINARIGAVYTDLVTTESATDPVITNRFPPPKITPAIECAAYEAYAPEDGDTIIVTTSTAASKECTNAETYNISDGATLTVIVDARPARTITLTGLTGGTATAAEVARALFADLVDAAEVLVTTSGTKVTLRSRTFGTSSTIQVTGGTAASVLGFDATAVHGTATAESATLAATDTSAQNIVDKINAGVTQATAVVAALAAANNRVRIETTYDQLSVTGTFAATMGFATTAATTLWQDAQVDDPIAFTVNTVGANTLGEVTVYVRTNYTRTKVYDSALSQVASGWSLTDSKHQSYGAGGNDIWEISLAHTADFISEELLEVEITATDSAANSTTLTYYLQVEDATVPDVASIVPWTTRTIRVEFTEAMDRSTARTSALYYRTVTAPAAFHSTVTVSGTPYTNVIEVPSATFDPADVGLYIGVYGAGKAPNNAVFAILQRITPTMLKVDGSLVAETLSTPPAVPKLVITPYRIVPGDIDEDTIRPIYCPAVRSVAAVDSESVAPWDDEDKYVNVTFMADLSSDVEYKLEVVNIEDAAGNEINTTHTFDSWALRMPPGREFDLWSWIPQRNKDDDVTGDLEKFVRSIEDVARVLLNTVDEFGDILDPYAAPETVLDHLIGHLGGNALPFVQGLSTTKKRDLVYVLAPMYKQKGTAVGLENAIAFFLGRSVTVVPDFVPYDTWTLGVSLLGYDTILGPSQSRIRYSFRIQYTGTLTASEQNIITQLAEFMRPAHTHFSGFVASS